MMVPLCEVILRDKEVSKVMVIGQDLDFGKADEVVSPHLGALKIVVSF